MVVRLSSSSTLSSICLPCILSFDTIRCLSCPSLGNIPHFLSSMPLISALQLDFYRAHQFHVAHHYFNEFDILCDHWSINLLFLSPIFVVFLSVLAYCRYLSRHFPSTRHQSGWWNENGYDWAVRKCCPWKYSFTTVRHTWRYCLCLCDSPCRQRYIDKAFSRACLVLRLISFGHYRHNIRCYTSFLCERRHTLRAFAVRTVPERTVALHAVALHAVALYAVTLCTVALHTVAILSFVFQFYSSYSVLHALSLRTLH